MAATVELDTQTTEQIDERLIADVDFQRALREADEQLYLHGNETNKIDLSRKLREDLRNAEMFVDPIKQEPNNKGARVSLRSAVVKFIQGIVKRMTHPKTGESGGVIDVGDLSKESSRAKVAFFEKLSKFHPPDSFFDRSFLKFVDKISQPDYEMLITKEADVDDGGLTQFENDLKELPVTLQVFIVQRIIRDPDVSMLLGVTDPEKQLTRLVPEIQPDTGAAQNHTPLPQQNVAEQQRENLQRQYQRASESSVRGGLSTEEINRLDQYKAALAARFGVNTEIDPAHIAEYIQRKRKYDIVMDYIIWGKEQAAAKHEKRIDQFEQEVDAILNEVGVGGLGGLPAELFTLSEKNRNAKVEGHNLDPSTGKKLAILNPEFLASKLINQTGYSFAAEKEITESIDELVYTFFDKVDTLPNEEFSKLYSEYNQGHAFNYIVDYFYGMSDTEGFAKAFASIPDEKLRKETQERAKVFFKEKILQRVLKRRTNTELFHNMFRILSKVEIAKWAEYMMNVDLTELASEMDDEVSPHAMEVWHNLIRHSIIQNDGFIDSGMFEPKYIKGANGESTEKLDINPLQIKFLNELKYVMKARGYEVQDENEWKFKQSFSKSKAISAMLMNTTAQLSQAKVNKDYDKTPIHDKIRLHGGPAWMYGGELGDRDIVKMNFLLMIKYSQQGFHGGKGGISHLKALNDNKIAHNPKKISDEGTKFRKFNENLVPENEYEEYINKLIEYEQDPDHRNTWYNMRKKFALPDVMGQGGWGIKGIEKAYEEFAEKMAPRLGLNYPAWKDATWDQRYEYFQSVMGARTEFLYATARAGEELDEFFDYDVYVSQCKALKRVPVEKEKLKREGKMRVKIAGRHHGDDEEDISYDKYRELRSYMLKGEAFHHLLLNDPESFLAEMYRMMDQTVEGTVKLKKTLNDGRSELPASEFYFLDQKGSVYSQLETEEKNKIIKLQYYANSRFKANENEENKENIKFLFDFYTKLNNHYGGDGKKARDVLHKYLQIAHNRAIYRMEQYKGNGFLRDEDFDIDESIFKNNPNNPNDPNFDNVFSADSKFIKDMILGGEGYKGLIPYFKDVVGDEKVTFGREMITKDGKLVRDGSKIGKIDGFYYRWGISHYDLDSDVVDPFGYIKLKDFFPHANAAGPEMLGRRIGQYKPFADLQQENFVKFYSALKKATLKATHGHGANIFEAMGEKGGVDDILKSMKVLDEYIGSKPGYREFTEQLVAVALSYVAMDAKIDKPYAMLLSLPDIKMPKFFHKNAKSHEHLENHAHNKNHKPELVIPLPIPPFVRPFIKMFLGQESSLSRIAFSSDKRSYEATMDEMRAMIHHWENDGVLGPEQAERLIENFHLDTKFMIMYRFLPDLFWYLMTLIGFVGIKEGYKEFDESAGGGKH